MGKTAPGSSIYNLTVTLLRTKPGVWRRLKVSGNTTLADFHLFLQVVMGWYNCHLYEFTCRDVSYGMPDAEAGYEVRDARRITLAKLLPVAGVGLRYRYDFGDDWEHQVKVHAIEPPEPTVHYPVCVAGKRACPPEDCGGPWGYSELLEILQDPASDEYQERLEWLDGPFDPDAFDRDEVNRRLQQPLADIRRWLDPDLSQL
jgi:hypothetical protein